MTSDPTPPTPHTLSTLPTTPGAGITCQQFVEFLSHYVDNELPASTNLAFQEHMTECPSCAAYIESFRRTLHVAQTAGTPSAQDIASIAPHELVEAIIAALPKNS